MRSYRVDLIDFHGKILSAENIEGATDDAAIEVARSIFGNRRHYRSVEVWQLWRLVYHDRRFMKPVEADSSSRVRVESSHLPLRAFSEHSTGYAASR